MIFAQSPQAKGRVERTAGTFQDRLVTPNCGWPAQPPWSRPGCADEFVPRFNHASAFPRSAPRPALPTAGTRSVPGTGPVFQAPPEGGPGQHGPVPVADTPTAARAGTPQLCRGDGGSPGGAGWSSIPAPEGRIIATQEAPPGPASLRNGNHQPHTLPGAVPVHWDEPLG